MSRLIACSPCLVGSILVMLAACADDKPAPLAIDDDELPSTPEQDAGRASEDASATDDGDDDAGFVAIGWHEVASQNGTTCEFGSATNLATMDTLDVFGTPAYFADGQVLPQGRYRITYVDGCMKYGPDQAWTVHAFADGADAFWLVGESTSKKIAMPPGTTGFTLEAGAFATFGECIEANKALEPKEIEFAGGKLGVWLQDTPYKDNVAGKNGRNPKWSLVLLGSCPDSLQGQ